MVTCDGNCRRLAASADNYVIFFLAGLAAYHGATIILDDRKVLQFIKNLTRDGFNQQLVFGAICFVLAMAWLTALEYAIQVFVPQFQISNLAGFPVAFLVFFGLFVQDSSVATRIAAAVLMPMLHVAVLHYYVISDFKQCVPLPMLYMLIPIVLGNYVWNRITPLASGVAPYAQERPRSRESADPLPARRSSYDKSDSGFEFENFQWDYNEQPFFRNFNSADGDGFR